MEPNPFLKRLMKAKKEDVIHSSAYAQAQNSAGMGAASTQSFDARMAMEKNRTKVQGYNNSRIMSGAFGAGPRAKTYTPPAASGAAGAAGAQKPAGLRPPMPKNPGITR